MKETPINNILHIFADVILLSFLVFFTSFLGIIITTGASLTAGFDVMFKLHDQKRATYIIKEFKDSFLKNFVQSTIVFFVIALLGIGLFFAFNYANNTGSIILLVSVYAALIELILFASYFFAILAVFESPSILQISKNTVLMLHGHPFVSIRLLGTIVAIGYLVFNVHSLFLFLGIPIYLYFNTFILKKTFSIYIYKIRGEVNEVSKL